VSSSRPLQSSSTASSTADGAVLSAVVAAKLKDYPIAERWVQAIRCVEGVIGGPAILKGYLDSLDRTYKPRAKNTISEPDAPTIGWGQAIAHPSLYPESAFIGVSTSRRRNSVTPHILEVATEMV